MSSILILLGILSASATPAVTVPLDVITAELTVQQGLYRTDCDWVSASIESLYFLPRGLSGYRIDGCSYSGADGGVLLPSRHLYFAIPPGAEVSLDVEARGVGVLESGSPDVGRVDVVDGADVFSSAASVDVPSSWGELVDTGIWRRAGMAHIVLHPVIRSDRGLLSADRLQVVLRYVNDRSLRSSSVSGLDGLFFNALFAGGNSVWRVSSQQDAESPFWGLPWVRISVDTAGVYVVNASEVPGALGASSSTLSLFCGRGREMGITPWDSVYVPRAVQILVEDGGDGIFDEGDRILFFGRGLSWWEASGDERPAHFMSRYSAENCYWLTWGGEDGARMGLVDGNISGAPPLPGDYIARYHFEKELKHAIGLVPSDWAWDRASGSYNIWAYHDFDTPYSSGEGTVVVGLSSSLYGSHHVRILVNGVELADTTWTGSGPHTFTLPCNGLQSTDNTLAIEFILEGMRADELYLDWFEVFTETGYSQEPGQVEVPLEWLADTGRYRVDWSSGLSDCYVFQLSGDTLASLIEFSGGSSFECDIPESWLRAAVSLWCAGSDDLLAVVSLEECSPGRIIEVLDGSEAVYVYADFFSSDVAGLDRPGLDRQLISLQEVFNEFNGGVRDPAAIRAMMDHCFLTWDPIPADLILVGYGNWDPRQFLTSRITYLDIIFTDDGVAVTDDVFVIGSGSTVPQSGVSRISIDDRTELQLIVEKAYEYDTGAARGNWQSLVLAAADDERSSKHTGDEVYHTVSMENLMNDHLPSSMRPRKLYLIFYDWNSMWKKPEAREAYIDAWSDGALLSIFLGHGGYDQLADEGLLYLEDTGLLACGGRLPVALFGSCGVGQFQNPVMDCISQEVTISQAGGAILALGATNETTGLPNEALISIIMDYFFGGTGLSIGSCTMLGKIDHGYSPHDRLYELFGDGSLELAFPDSAGTCSSTRLLTGESSVFSGEAPSPGLMLMRAFESCTPDTYYTFRQHKAIPYLSMGSLFYRGVAPAVPGFSTNAFVPVDADTGVTARVEFYFLGNDRENLSALYPFNLGIGSPSSSDTTGPDIELWVDGFRYVAHPTVSGEIVIRAILSDPSGINLLGNTGRQLALYTDDIPQDVSRYFSYYPGSGEAGELSVAIGMLEMGEHLLELRAADGLLNVSTSEIAVTVVSNEGVSFSDVFVFPNPCTSGHVSINWTQTAPGTVGISIFTVSGRRIASYRNIEGSAGYNQFVWDCRDTDGDAVASGTYIFRMVAGLDGTSSDETDFAGIIAVIR